MNQENKNFDFRELNNNLFSPNKIKSQNVLNIDFIKKFLKSFEEKGYYKENFGIFTKNYGYKSLWGLIMFQKWYDIFLDKKNNNFQLN